MRKKPQILDLVMVVAAISWLVEAKLTFRTSNQKSDFRISQTGGNQENIFKTDANTNDDDEEKDKDDTTSTSHKNNLISFTASSYPHFEPRKFTYDDLRQLFRSVGCVSDEIRVECTHDMNTTVVIENATFYSVPDENWLNCSRGPLGPLAMGGLASSEVELGSLGRHQQSIFAGVSGFSSLTNVRDLRQALNGWCSGMSRKTPCTFNLQLDHEKSLQWGQGIVDVYYRCVPNEITHRKCNDDVRVSREIGFLSSSQFLMSPVYPKYYVGGRRCRWTLRADPGQRIQLRFLDISLREEISSSSGSSHSSQREPPNGQCTDSLRVTERGRNLLSMCGESKQDIVLLSDANTLEVRLDTESRGIFSRRGILAEFWPIGCATLREPSFGYRHMRNFSHATYACTEGYIFQDTLEKTRTLQCNTAKGQWTDHLVNCVSLQYLRRHGNSTIQTLLASKEGLVQRGSSQRIKTLVPSLSAAWFSDIVIPAVIVSIVVVVSLFAIVVLLLLRRHMAFEGHDTGIYHREHDDRNALTPGSARRGPSPLVSSSTSAVASSRLRPELHQNNHNHNGGIVMHVDLDQQREELFLC